MTEDSQLKFENVQTSNRSAEELAQLHGYENLAQFAESLPENASVSDIGAGDSTLGAEVGKLRPDVRWTNVDFSYFQALPDAASNSPENVQYIAGDATSLDQILEPESQDVVLSYWMLPHLSLHSDEPVRLAAKGMFALAMPNGLLSIGPDMSRKGKLPARQWPPAFLVVKDSAVNSENFAERVVRDTKAQGFTRTSLILSSEVAAPFFGTSRYLKREGKKHFLLDPESGEYIKPASPRAARLAGQLAVLGTKHLYRQRKARKGSH